MPYMAARALLKAVLAVTLVACARGTQAGAAPELAASRAGTACATLAVGRQAFRTSDTAAVNAVVGDYRLWIIPTTPGYPSPPWGGMMRVERTAPNDLVFVSPLNPSQGRIQPLTASVHWADAEAAAPSRWRLRGHSFVGAREGTCLDCGSGYHRVEWVSPHGFGGTWYSKFGSVALIGTDGRQLHAVEGEFCARRVSGA